MLEHSVKRGGDGDADVVTTQAPGEDCTWTSVDWQKE